MGKREESANLWVVEPDGEGDSLLDIADRLRLLGEQNRKAFATLRAENERLLEELDDWRISQARAADEKCDAGEHHCSCVGVLRARVAELETSLAKVRGALGRIVLSYRLLLSGKPVRDVTETLAECDAALAEQGESDAS